MTEYEDSFFAACTRALGNVDLNPHSPTAGCSDRAYWHYVDGKLFPVGSFQMSMLAFAIAHEAHPQREGLVFGRASKSTSQWWARQIEAKGFLEEYFLGQQSFCATAHTTLAAAILARVYPEWGLGATCYKALSNLAQVAYRPDSANQTLAARVAWDLVHEGETANENPFVVPLSPEGWLSEYGGFDLGYSLECLDLCVTALLVVGRDDARLVYKNLAVRNLKFLRLAVVRHAFSPFLGSRENPHLLLGGLFALATAGVYDAQEILHSLVPGVDASKSAPSGLVRWQESDDKYLSFFHLGSLALAHHALHPVTKIFPYVLELHGAEMPGAEVLPHHGVLRLERAGLVFFSSPSIRVGISLRKGHIAIVGDGGTFAQFGSYLLSNRGEMAKFVANPEAVRIDSTSTTLTIEVPFHLANISPKVVKMQSFLWRSALNLAMLFPFVRRALNTWVLQKVNKPSTLGPLMVIRHIQIDGARVSVKDTFHQDAQSVWLNRGWCLQEGHSTHLLSVPNEMLSCFGNICAGTQIVVAGENPFEVQEVDLKQVVG